MNNLKRLKELLDNMIVPEKRKCDLKWLKKNLAIRNKTHPSFFEAMSIIESKVKKHNMKNIAKKELEVDIEGLDK